MLTLEIPAWHIVVRTFVVYSLLLIGLRLIGKRELGQMTTFDLVLLLLIANALQNAMVGSDTSLIGGLLAAALLLVLDAILARLRLRSQRLRRLLEGSPTILISHGEILEANLRREGVDLEELQTALREHGVNDAAKVEMAVLETDGTISVILADEHTEKAKRTVRMPAKRRSL
jgi:uncharacterized membrane protein YcaP (DUF421 family)